VSDGVLVLHEERLGIVMEASGRAYAPHSEYRVGAALFCRDGAARFVGCNVENASYGLTLCAERAVAVYAIAAGHRDFEVIGR
jgi:cytidine deaminase